MSYFIILNKNNFYKSGGVNYAIQQEVSFQDALDIIESFPEYQQQDIIDIVRKRLNEKGRDAIACNIKKTKEEYLRGECKKGSVEDIMQEIE